MSGEPPELPTLDHSVVGVLAALGADAPGFMDALVGDFVDAVERHTVAMDAAVRSGDGQALLFAAHSLRGSCGIIGARSMAALSGRLEKTAATISPAEAFAMIDGLEQEYEAVRSALAAVITGLAGNRSEV